MFPLNETNLPRPCSTKAADLWPRSVWKMLRGEWEMKARMTNVQPRESLLSGNKQVRSEIRSFMEALDSYPERFAEEPGITFEQHLYNRVSPGTREPRRRMQSRHF